MYLPTLDEEQRAAITNFFFEYRKATQHQLWDSYGAHEHWAKIEVFQSPHFISNLVLPKDLRFSTELVVSTSLLQEFFVMTIFFYSCSVLQ